MSKTPLTPGDIACSSYTATPSRAGGDVFYVRTAFDAGE